MSTARKISASDDSLFPPSTPESKRREALDKELHDRLIEIGTSNPKVPGEKMLKCAGKLGQMIVGYSIPLPPALNLAVTDDGELLFTIFGVKSRKADFWIEEANGEFTIVATNGEERLAEVKLKISDARKALEWLAGRSETI